MRQFGIIATFLFVIFAGVNSHACDGRDRYAKNGSASDLYLFPVPVHESCGYRILPPDQEDQADADDDRGFHWARSHAIAFIRLACFRTQKRMGSSAYPLAIFDLSSENGDTPVTMAPGKPPRARHPGNSHDGGLNLDLSYYLTSLKGLYDDEDYSACSDHFEETAEKETDEPKDSHQCQGVPDRLALEHQACFFVQLFRLDQEFFEGSFISQIGIDWEIQKSVIAQLEKWNKAEKFGVDLELIEAMKQIFTANRFGGWARFHHHHIHLRLSDLPYRGVDRVRIDRILEEERALDMALLKKVNQTAVPSSEFRCHRIG